jgi:hypothetical protein
MFIEIIDFFWTNFSPFYEKKIEKRFLLQFFNYKITINCHNCLQHEREHKVFLLSYFEYGQNWLNIFVDVCHLGNITKLEKKHLLELLLNISK